MTDPIVLLDEASWFLETDPHDNRSLRYSLRAHARTVGDLRCLLALARDAERLREALYLLVRACRNSKGMCLLCGVPASTMHESQCPVEVAIRVLEPAYAEVMSAALKGTDR